MQTLFDEDAVPVVDPEPPESGKAKRPKPSRYRPLPEAYSECHTLPGHSKLERDIVRDTLADDLAALEAKRLSADEFFRAVRGSLYVLSSAELVRVAKGLLNLLGGAEHVSRMG